MEFYGNEICCGSYACLNAIKNPEIPLKLFEISTSVPFGVKHVGDSFFDHLLTTFCDPNTGIDRAIPLWGYEQKKEQFRNKIEAVRYIKSEILQNPVVLGPVDMGYLSYLPVSYMYRRMDHYIVLQEINGKMYCVDSEGVSALELTDEQLLDLISVERVLEAEGIVCVRSFSQVEEFDWKNILERSMVHAWENLTDAENDGQGSQAFLNCYNYLNEQDIRLWKLPFLYDINYLIQRKLLFMKLLREVAIHLGYRVKNESIVKQKALLVNVFEKLRKYNRIAREDFEQLAEWEKQIGQISNAKDMNLQ